MIKAVIFDRDGVIIDSGVIHVNSTIEAFKLYGIELKEEEKDYIIGRHPADYVKEFKKKYSFPIEEFRAKQKEMYYKHFDSVKLIEKTIDFIKRIHNKKLLAVTTSSSKESTLRVLKRAGILEMFNVIVTSEDYSTRKPDPEPYMVTANKLNMEPEYCLVIEDSPVGVESAKLAGMKCIAIPTRYTKHQDLSKADLIVDTADEITEEVLEKL